MICLQDLPWLPRPADDFRQRCADLAEHTDDAVAAIRALAATALDESQSRRLVRTIEKHPALTQALEKALPSFRLGIISNATLDLIAPDLITAGWRHGINLQPIFADFDQAVQEALNPDSDINTAAPDAVLLAIDYRGYPFANGTFGMCAENLTAPDCLAYLNQIRQGFATNAGSTCIVQTLAMPPSPLIGSLDAQVEGALRKEIAAFNAHITGELKNSPDVLLDIASLASAVGSYQWFDERQWYTSRIPMSNELTPLYCEHIARTVSAIRGKSKKCVVLDLDNTLWGGVIGDDGLENIHIGQGNPRGESHLALQRYLLELKELGIVLAVCSKNEKETALLPFREHPDMLIKEDDIAVFVANWEDKAGNIRAIAKTLDIGLDAIVFVDDNPFERELVKNFIPEVAVPELPDDAALYPRYIAAAGYFESVSLTAEDRQRSQQYMENAKRSMALQSAGNIDEFLSSLQMEIHFNSFDAFNRKRITQLINKTNQFNLTTRRYTERDVEGFEAADNCFTLQVKLTDRYGDNGMISVVLCKETDREWEVDIWLMSCRVIRRKVEEAVCNEIVRQAAACGIHTIRGIYRPTAKNGLVENHYKDLGFSQTATSDEQSVWKLSVADYQFKDTPITVVADH